MTCWAGPPTEFELRLLSPQPTYALEQLRQRFLYALTTIPDPVKAARVLLQMAFETEIGSVLTKLIPVPPSVPESTICERRRFLPIDRDMQIQRFLVAPALDELSQVPDIPAPYVDLIRLYVASRYPRYRTCALAAALCLAARFSA